MKHPIKHLAIFGIITVSFLACEDYLYKEQTLVVETKIGFNDWIDYRSAALGLYAQQQELAEQLIVLGELRGDLIKTTSNADVDLVEIQNFSVSDNNKYAKADNFYKLIASCNALIRTLTLNHPEVLQDNSEGGDYHRIYGEALCMRGWAYFNAARIYGKVPYIPEQLTNYNDIVDYIMKPELSYYIDEGRFIYDVNGLDNIDVSDTVYYPVDTVYTDTVNFETYARRFVDIYTIVDSVKKDLTERLNYVGVEYGEKEGVSDQSWEAIIWTDYSRNFLLGLMELEIGNINEAYERYFYPLLYNSEHIESGSSSAIRFGLDNTYRRGNWKNIHTAIGTNEHIFTMWFGNRYQQTHELQKMFDNDLGCYYSLKPTAKAIDMWETEWKNQFPDPNSMYDFANKEVNELEEIGTPGDFYRGHRVSYVYKDGDRILDNKEVLEMMEYRAIGQEIDQLNIMENVDTLVYKYTIGKNNFDDDHFVVLYRAAAVHLYAAEIFNYSHYMDGESEKLRVTGAPRFLDGLYMGSTFNEGQLGVRGRLGLYIPENNRSIIVLQDPFTNEVKGTRDFNKEGGLQAQREWYEEVILNERAKELAFEGERFYDLMRVAKRRNDPSFLADMVADAKGKYSGGKREEIRSLLMNQDNWYLPFYINYSY